MPAATAHVVAIFAMLFAAASAFVLIHAVEHIDPPDPRAGA